ncbi:hypothetical protein [Streptomyces sp. NPDC001500]
MGLSSASGAVCGGGVYGGTARQGAVWSAAVRPGAAEGEAWGPAPAEGAGAAEGVAAAAGAADVGGAPVVRRRAARTASAGLAAESVGDRSALGPPVVGRGPSARRSEGRADVRCSGDGDCSPGDC